MQQFSLRLVFLLGLGTLNIIQGREILIHFSPRIVKVVVIVIGIVVFIAILSVVCCCCLPCCFLAKRRTRCCFFFSSNPQLVPASGIGGRFISLQANLCKVAPPITNLSNLLATSCNKLVVVDTLLSSREAIKHPQEVFSLHLLATILLLSSSRWCPLAILHSPHLTLDHHKVDFPQTIKSPSPPSRLLITLTPNSSVDSSDKIFCAPLLTVMSPVVHSYTHVNSYDSTNYRQIFQD